MGINLFELEYIPLLGNLTEEEIAFIEDFFRKQKREHTT
jgi:hypothetical protein